MPSASRYQKYNSTLDTLDLSHNPCCGPGLEGVRLIYFFSATRLSIDR